MLTQLFQCPFQPHPEVGTAVLVSEPLKKGQRSDDIMVLGSAFKSNIGQFPKTGHLEQVKPS